MKKHLTLLLIAISITSYSQNTKSVEQQAKEYAQWYATLSPIQQRNASIELVDKLNRMDAHSKGIWVATLKNNTQNTVKTANTNEITEELKLTDYFDADGQLILNFQKNNGEEIQFSSIEESIINKHFTTNEYDEFIIKPEYLNKKFKASYTKEKMYNEELAANGEDGNYIGYKLTKLILQ